MHYLGIDIGTQSLKAVVIDGALRPVGTTSVPYQPVYPKPGWAEQDTNLWLNALRPAIAGALAEAGLSAADIASIAVCGQLDGCIATDANGDALAPAILWMDRRATSGIRGIDADLVRDRSGLVLDATHMAAKIRWSLENTDHGRKASVFHQPVSFLVGALTGARVMDPSLASTSMVYDLKTGTWDPELLAAFGIDPAILPAIAPTASVAGGLSTRGAALTGLKAGTPVAVGTGDDFSNPIGCGLSGTGTVGVILGTGEVVCALSDTLTIDQNTLVETHAFPTGHYHLGNPGWMSGGAVRWFLSTFSVTDAVEFSAIAAEAPPGCDGLLFIPALSGAMAPRWIASARGAFYGMTAAHTKGHFARAILEGTSFAMRDVIDRMTEMGVGTQKIRIMGGGAESTVWTQIRSDLTGKPVEALSEGDASAMGAALLAAVAAGAQPSVAAASAALEIPLTRIEPISANSAVYEHSYGQYRKLFDTLEPMYEA